MKRFDGKNALVVDDEPSTRTLLRAALEDVGMHVTEAVDGADAIHKSLAGRFDLTTMDIRMPNVNGLDAIHALRTVDPACRIIVVSAFTDEAHREAVRELGVDHFLSKPIHIQEVYAAVSDVLACAGTPCPDSGVDGDSE